MIIPILYAIGLGALLYFFRRWSILAKSLILFYLVSAIFGLLMFYTEPDAEYLYHTVYTPLYFLFAVLFVWFYSFSSFDDNIVTSFKMDELILKRICLYIGVFFLPLSIVLAYNAYNILTTVDLSYYRIEANYQAYYEGEKLFSLAYYSAFLSYIPHFLLFYSFRFNFEKHIRVLLLLASFAFAFQTLCNAGRDGIVYWFMNSFVFYELNKSAYSEEIKSKIRKMLLLLIVPIVLVFLIISAFRFTLSGTIDIKELVNPIVSYAGQPIHIFSQAFYTSAVEMEGNYLSYKFGTFIKSFIGIYGYAGAIGVSLLYFAVIRLLLSVLRKSCSIWDFFILYLIYQIPLYGVFYYRQGIQSMEMLYLIFAGILLLLKLFVGRRH